MLIKQRDAGGANLQRLSGCISPRIRRNRVAGDGFRDSDGEPLQSAIAVEVQPEPEREREQLIPPECPVTCPHARGGEPPPFLLPDDIRLWTMLKFWRELDLPKLDVTSFGHWSGTGLADRTDGGERS